MDPPRDVARSRRCRGALLRARPARSATPSITPAGRKSTVANQTWKGTPVSTTPTTPTSPGVARAHQLPARRRRPIPAGYTADTGSRLRRCTRLGWVREDSLGRRRTRRSTSRPTPASATCSPTSASTRSSTCRRRPASPAPVKTPAAWELAVPPAATRSRWPRATRSYVTDSAHRVRVEGAGAIAGFTPTSTTRSQQATVTVAVTTAG